MTFHAENSALSPEPLDLLVDTLPPRVLLEVIKNDAQLEYTVLQGFAARVTAFSHQVVRQRLTREAERQPELARKLYEEWLRVFAGLMTQLDDPAFDPTPTLLKALTTTFGGEVLDYGLRHAAREDVRVWAARLAEIRTTPRSATPAAAPTPAPAEPEERRDATADLREKIAALQQQLKTVEQANAAFQRDIATLKSELQQMITEETAQRKLAAAADERADREHRRARRAEEELELLRKQWRQAQTAYDKQPAPAALANQAEVLTLLQRAVTLLRPEPEKVQKKEKATPAPAPAPTPNPPPTRATGAPSVTLPTTRGKQSYPIAGILAALARNDEALIGRLRDGVALLDKQPPEERAATLAELQKAGVPRPILSGPLKPALIDGSNVANMSPQSKGRLAYLTQIRQAAWEEGYFPVILIIDASLPHQIDQPEQLLEMVERGEIVMVPAGTSADALLIEEANARQAVVITNDRMAEWPAAKTVEKRHIEASAAGVHLGNFHRSSRWFPW